MITIARFKQIVEGLLYYVEEDYQTVPEEQTLLYQMFYGVTDRNFDFYEQAKAIFTRRNTSPRKVIATMEFPKDKTHFPCIVIREPGRGKGSVDPFGGFGAPPLDEFGNDPYRREGFVNSNRSDVQLMCLSDNMLESILIGEVLWTLLIGARNTLEQEFVRFSFNAEDLIAQNDLFPLPILIKTISVEIEDVNRYASIIRPELITKFGFGSGLDDDAAAVRALCAAGVSFMVSSSCSKNFGLYGERAGGLHVVTPNADEATVVTSIIKAIVRAEYSNPATHGAAIVNEVLNDEELYAVWEDEVTGMRTRIRSMRESLVAAGEAVGADLSFAVRQAGMFSFTGLNAEQMLALREKYGVYGVANGRICIAGLNTENVTYVAKAIAGVR